MRSCNAHCLFSAVFFVFYSRLSVLFVVHQFVYRDVSINYACVSNGSQATRGVFSAPQILSYCSDLLFYHFIKMGTMFPFCLCLFCCPIKCKSFFFIRYTLNIILMCTMHYQIQVFVGIKGNIVNCSKFKVRFLLFYCSKDVLSLFGRVFLYF